ARATGGASCNRFDGATGREFPSVSKVARDLWVSNGQVLCPWAPLALSARRRQNGAMKTLRTETADGVRSLVLCRAAEYNTITPDLRDELAVAVEEADDDRAVHVI